jgi:hypothetical protein
MISDLEGNGMAECNKNLVCENTIELSDAVDHGNYMQQMDLAESELLRSETLIFDGLI